MTDILKTEPFPTPWKKDDRVIMKIGDTFTSVYLKDLNQEELEIYAERMKQEILNAYKR